MLAQFAQDTVALLCRCGKKVIVADSYDARYDGDDLSGFSLRVGEGVGAQTPDKTLWIT
jgi:hypothetical protein